ncbi:MAG: hypothetical protein JWO05_1398 [Gemmatimonadetes bacterium]|nr:hypothetical protein [Gemmatimonadota bacterium]
MKRALIALVMAATPAFAQRGMCRVDSSAAWAKRQRSMYSELGAAPTDSALRRSLLRAAGLTDLHPIAFELGVHVAGDAGAPSASDSSMVAQLVKLASTRGSTWPTRSVVGSYGTHSIWRLAQRDTAVGRAVLKRMMEAGPDESAAVDVATLEDRMRLAWGRKQLYGTQFLRSPEGRLSLAPMEDSAHADLRRGEAGLPPFRLSLCLSKLASGR